MLGFQFSRNPKKWRIPDIEPHEILLDKLAKRKEEELGISEKKFEVPLFKKIIQGLFISAIFIIFLLFAKTFQLQVIEGKNLLAQAKDNKFIIDEIQAERGVIYDRNLNQIVFNRPSFDLILEKGNLPQSGAEREKVLKEVSQILKVSFEDLEKKISESENPQVPISENLDYLTLITLETKISELPGFQIINNPVREYKDGETISHLIGFTGKIWAEELKTNPEVYSITDYIGRDGIEKSYEEFLRKNPGKLKIEKDALGNLISKEIIQYPESGKSLVLWLDSGLQKKIKEELGKEIQILGASGGVAVALDPKTGGVISLVSLPSFDSNLFQKGADQEELKKLLEDPKKLKPLFNRAISGQGYLTGSTIKPLIASAALEEKVISVNEKINCQGEIVVESKDVPGRIDIYHDWKTHGLTNIKKAIAESCNVFFYTVGGGYGERNGLGPTRIKNYLELFGWGKKTGIDLPGEGEGFIPSPEWKKSYFKEKERQIWYDGDTYNLSIGQGFIAVTPLQVATAFSAIANGGKLLQPQVVKSIIGVSENSNQEIEPKIIRENFIDQNNLQIVREGMRQAVTSGSATGYLDLLPVSAAAKTGTAQTGKKDKYGNELFYNWVTVFAPYEDPEIVLTIMIENVPQVSAVVLPIAKNVLEWYFTPTP